jgi:hypothetical protein
MNADQRRLQIEAEVRSDLRFSAEICGKNLHRDEAWAPAPFFQSVLISVISVISGKGLAITRIVSGSYSLSSRTGYLGDRSCDTGCIRLRNVACK